MRSTRLYAIITFLSILGIGSANGAPVPELLKPVDEKISAKLNAPGNFGFRLQRFVAKRYRIVEIDFDLLDRSDSVFTITPFDDLQVTVKGVKDTVAANDEQLKRWTGQLDLEGLGVYATGSDNDRVPLKSLPISLWVRSGPHEVPLKLARTIAMERGNSAALQAMPSVAPSNDPNLRITAKIPLRTVNGEWLVLNKGKRVRLRPIDDDPRYHIVYEVDPDKEASGSHGDANSARKLNAITMFREQLERERLQEAAQGR